MFYMMTNKAGHQVVCTFIFLGVLRLGYLLNVDIYKSQIYVKE
jgi:hypothetical protein